MKKNKNFVHGFNGFEIFGLLVGRFGLTLKGLRSHLSLDKDVEK